MPKKRKTEFFLQDEVGSDIEELNNGIFEENEVSVIDWAIKKIWPMDRPEDFLLSMRQYTI